MLRRFFAFPDPVNETAARVVAAGVAVLAWSLVLVDADWVVVLIAYGFVARVLTGPRLSPLGLLATRVVAPRLPAKPVPGPPKRFAQAIGAALSLTAVVAFVTGNAGAGEVLVAMIGLAATLEASLAFCIGCKLFAVLMRVGVIPQRVCERCLAV